MLPPAPNSDPQSTSNQTVSNELTFKYQTLSTNIVVSELESIIFIILILILIIGSYRPT